MRRAASVLLLHAAVAIALTWPLATTLDDHFAGGRRTDAWNSAWSFWWVHDALSRGELPLFNHLLQHPDGGRLVVADPLNALLAYPLVGALGAVGAYGLIVLLHSTFSGVAAHALGRAAGGQGWVAGLAWQLAPICVSHLQNGSSEAVSTGWLALVGLALLRLVQAPSALRATLAGLALAVCAVAGWYGGVGAWCLFAGFLLFNPGQWRWMFGAAALALALTLPWASFVADVAQAPDGLVHIKAGGELARLRRTIGPADPRIFFVPGAFRSPNFPELFGAPGDYVHTAYLGYALLALALWGSRGGGSGPWWTAFFLGFTLALGPVVVMDGFPVSVAGRAVPLPYMLLEGLPGFSGLSLLYRIAGVCSLALAVLADRAPRPAIGALVVAAELLLVSPAKGLPEITSVPQSDALEALADAPAGAVINLPVTAARSYLYEQTVHGKALTASLNTGANKPALEILKLAREVKREKATLADLTERARGLGVRYVVVHKGLLVSETWIESASAIKAQVPVLAEDATVRVHRLF